MKKRIMIFTVVFCLLIAGIPRDNTAAADDSGMIYVSINDRLTDYYPYYYGSSLYIPLGAFQELGVTYTSDMDASTLTLKYGGASLIFDLGTGDCYDSNGSSYGAKAIYVGGLVYMPAYAVGVYFGMAATYIAGGGTGDVLRVKTGGAAYSDSGFMSAASAELERRTAAYYAPKATPTPERPPTPTPSPTPTPPIDRSSTVVTLSFEGAPTNEILEELEKYEFPALFLLNAADALENQDILRRAVGMGHRLGVWLEDEEASFSETAELIYAAARDKTLFVSATGDAAETASDFAVQNSLVYVGYDLETLTVDEDFNMELWLLKSGNRADILFSPAETDVLAEALFLMSSYQFTIGPTRER